ncbi:MAG: hypothetical protein U0132_11865 [Gemmatimonadaceae bacterium]
MSHGLIEEVPGFASLGIVAFTTTRAAGDFGLTSSNDSSAEVFNRWLSVGALAGIGPERIACAHQVHGGTVLVHRGGWGGFLRSLRMLTAISARSARHSWQSPS